MNWQALFILIAIALSITVAIVEPFVPEPRNPGVYRGDGPEEGVLPFQ